MLDCLNIWLKEYSPIINTVLTIGTIVYVIITWRILLAQKKLNAQNILPFIYIDETIFNHLQENEFFLYKLILRNVGRGPAINITIIKKPTWLKIERAPTFLNSGESGELIFTIPVFDFKHEGFLEKGKLNPPAYKLTVEFEDMDKRKHQTKYQATKYDSWSGFN